MAPCLCFICNHPLKHPLETTRHLECGSFKNRLDTAKFDIEKYEAIIADIEHKRRIKYCKPFCTCHEAFNFAKKKLERNHEIVDSMEFAIFLRKTHPVPQWPS
jgi:hypothetical protein